jgi:hypothetical protein
MNIRKIAVVGGFAVGAALSFAPLASAVPDPTLVTDTLDTEIASQNSVFEFDALLAGDSADITKGGVGVFDSIIPADESVVAPQTAPFSTLDYELYGVSPGVAGVSGDTGPYDELNGALTEFDNAYNVELYSLFNGGNLDTDISGYIENNAINHALTLGSTTDAFDYLYNFAIGDLGGFFDTNLSFLDLPV